MKKAALILSVGLFVVSCSKKDTTTQIDTQDSLSADTITPGTVPVQPDTMAVPATQADTIVTALPDDSLRKAK